MLIQLKNTLFFYHIYIDIYIDIHECTCLCVCFCFLFALFNKTHIRMLFLPHHYKNNSFFYIKSKIELTFLCECVSNGGIHMREYFSSHLVNKLSFGTFPVVHFDNCKIFAFFRSVHYCISYHHHFFNDTLALIFSAKFLLLISTMISFIRSETCTHSYKM